VTVCTPSGLAVVFVVGPVLCLRALCRAVFVFHDITIGNDPMLAGVAGRKPVSVMVFVSDVIIRQRRHGDANLAPGLTAFRTFIATRSSAASSRLVQHPAQNAFKPA